MVSVEVPGIYINGWVRQARELRELVVTRGTLPHLVPQQRNHHLPSPKEIVSISEVL